MDLHFHSFQEMDAFVGRVIPTNVYDDIKLLQQQVTELQKQIIELENRIAINEKYCNNKKIGGGA